MQIRQTLRSLSRTPGFSATVVLILALGIGATSSLFTVVHSVLLKPLLLPDSERLVQIWEANPAHGFSHTQVAGGTWKLWQEQNRSFSQIAIATPDQFNLSGAKGQLPERINAEVATSQALSLLGAEPALGRFFSRTDDAYGAEKTVVLSWDLWKRRFDGSSAILGKKLLLDTQPYTIIGVLPQWFHYPDPRTQVWVALLPMASPAMMNSHDAHNFTVIGRLRPGFSILSAQQDLSRISLLRAESMPPNDFIAPSANVVGLLDAGTYQVRTLLSVLFAATSCLLLIACLNSANLLVARSASRRREFAIRSALGGTRRRLIVDRVLESLVLCSAAGGLGVIFANFTLQWLVARRTDLPRVETIQLDAPAVAFTIAMVLACSVVAGLAPALSERFEQLLPSLQEQSRAVSGNRRSWHFRRGLMVAEVALTVVLLIAAGLFLNSYRNMRSVPLGVSTDNTLTLSLNLPAAPQYQTPAQRVAFYEQLLTRMRALPGVQAAGLADELPGQGEGADDGETIAEIPMRSGTMYDVQVRAVSPDYFRSLGIPLLRGRTFSSADRLDRGRQTIVSQSFVRAYLQGRDPIGLHINDLNNAPEGATDPRNEIVGVVADTRSSPASPVEPIVYFPLWTGVRSNPTVFLRTSGEPLEIATTVHRLIAAIDPSVAVTDILTYDDLVGKNTVDARFSATLLSVFAALSVTLAAVGLFGVLSFLATMRTPEIGVRIALGARREHILYLLFREGLQPALLGLLLGILLSAGLARSVASLLYGAQPLQPFIFVSASLTLLAIAMLACLLPAWRASRLDPVAALRAD